MATPTAKPVGQNSKVIVMIVPDMANVSRSELITRLYSDDMFDIIIVKGEISTLTSGDMNRDLYESMVFNNALTMMNDKHPDSYCIIVKDTSVSMAGPDLIAKIVKECIATSKAWDVCYLCKWSDKCQLYDSYSLNDGNDGNNEKKINTPLLSVTAGRNTPSVQNAYSIMRTYSPQGLQAVMFSPSGRMKITGKTTDKDGNKNVKPKILSEMLTKDIYEGKLRAHCVVPNLFNYDIMLNALSNQDYMKLNECEPVTLSGKENNKLNPYNVMWVVCVILLIIIVIFIALRYMSRTKKKAE